MPAVIPHAQPLPAYTSASPPIDPNLSPVRPHVSQYLPHLATQQIPATINTQAPPALGPHPQPVAPAPTMPAPGLARRGTLAQPLPPDWAKAARAAAQETEVRKSLKVMQQEMADRVKKTVVLVIYHTVKSVCFLASGEVADI